MRKMLKDSLKTRDISEYALNLGKAATLVRKDILSQRGIKLTSSFMAQCQEDSIPKASCFHGLDWLQLEI